MLSFSPGSWAVDCSPAPLAQCDKKLLEDKRRKKEGKEDSKKEKEEVGIQPAFKSTDFLSRHQTNI